LEKIASGNGNFIEFGAQWVHGSENNPIYDFCQPLGLLNEDLKSNLQNFKRNSLSYSIIFFYNALKLYLTVPCILPHQMEHQLVKNL
jgi:hypothetical protein